MASPESAKGISRSLQMSAEPNYRTRTTQIPRRVCPSGLAAHRLGHATATLREVMATPVKGHRSWLLMPPCLWCGEGVKAPSTVVGFLPAPSGPHWPTPPAPRDAVSLNSFLWPCEEMEGTGRGKKDQKAEERKNRAWFSCGTQQPGSYPPPQYPRNPQIQAQ